MKEDVKNTIVDFISFIAVVILDWALTLLVFWAVALCFELPYTVAYGTGIWLIFTYARIKLEPSSKK